MTLNILFENSDHETFLERLVEKGEVAERRKSKFSPSHKEKRAHWQNHAGTYHDEADKRAPKYWKGQKQIRGPRMIRRQGDLIDAIRQISTGYAAPRDYTGRNAQDSDRLHVAYLWHKQGCDYTPADIRRLSPDQLNEALGVVLMQPY